MKTLTAPSIRRGILAIGILAVTATVSHAAVVTWGAATNITGDSNVSTAGTLVNAVNPGVSPVTTTVNGVTFNGLGFFAGTETSGNFTFNNLFGAANQPSPSAPFVTLSAQYQALLTGFFSSNPFSVTMSGLTVGAQYQVQLWSNKSTPTGGLFTATAGNVLVLNSNPTNLDGGLGQFGIGTFIADAATQSIAFTPTAFLAGLNGIQLRQTAAAPAVVPEPGSALAGMLALGVCLSGLLARSRRNTAAV